MGFATPQGFNSGDQFFAYLKDTFDTLYQEGKAGSPKMMSVGLHCRLIGRPGRAAALARFIDYVKSHKKVWIARRIDIARHWMKRFPYKAPALVPSKLDVAAFVETFGSIFEHSPFIAERTHDYELGPANDTATGLHFAMRNHFRAATPDERLNVLRAHPDLAGRIDAAERLTGDSEAEQASAGLDALTDAERETLTALNTAYVEKFGFPFIIAVRDHTKDEILAAFKARIEHDRDAEFAEACKQVERIAELRLKEMLPD
jgi:OHCU decarboxylase